MNKSLNFEEISLYSTPKVSPGFLLWKVSTKWRSQVEKVLSLLNLTHPQFVILASIGWLTKENSVTTQSQVGKMAGLDPNTVSQILRGLEKKGLIQRESSQDRRAKNPQLTKRGTSLLTKAIPTVEKADRDFFAVLSNQEQAQLITLFNQFLSLK